MKAAYALTKIDFRQDPCSIGPYLQKRTAKNEIFDIVNCIQDEVAPITYAHLEKCQASSASVERSFSMLSKLLAKDRNFKPENIKMYLVLHYNSVTNSNIKCNPKTL